MGQLNPWQVSGIIDGEGSFAITRVRQSSGDSYSPAFTLALRADDKEAMQHLYTFFGFGSLYRIKHGTYYPKSPHKTRDQYRYAVTGKENCRKLVEHFDRFPLFTKKKHDYAAWRVFVLLNREDTRREGGRIKAILESGRKYREPD